MLYISGLIHFLLLCNHSLIILCTLTKILNTNRFWHNRVKSSKQLCHMSRVTCHMSQVTCHLSHVPVTLDKNSTHKNNILHVTCHMSHVTCHVSHVTCHRSPATCHMSLSHSTKTPLTKILRHVSCVTCHVSPVTCHLSHVPVTKTTIRHSGVTSTPKTYSTKGLTKAKW